MNFFNRAKDAFKGYDKVKTLKKLTYEELFSIMEAGSYPCGEPEISGKGIMRCIRFPEVDKYQIQVAITGSAVTVSKVYSGIGGFAKEAVGNAVTDGWYDIVNPENIDLNQMTRTIGEELKKLLATEGLLKR